MMPSLRLFTCLLFLFLSGSALAQDDFICKMAETEGRAAEGRMLFQEIAGRTNYDVHHYGCHWVIDPSQRFIEGYVDIRFSSTEDNMDEISLDLTSSLIVDGITLNGVTAPFTHQDNEILVSLPTTMMSGQPATLSVSYHGVPADSDRSFVQDTHAGVPIVWTLSEPYGAKDWWPCKQSLDDKADSLDIWVTAPASNRVASNGLLVKQELVGENIVHHWKHRYPIVPYLVAIAATNYTAFSTFYHHAPNDSFEILNYVYPESLSETGLVNRITTDVMRLFSDAFGPYPFTEEKYGHAQFSWPGGMEHQTMSFMYNFSFELIAHELAHQWFGDKITCGSWKDIWLNEGFATYATGLTFNFTNPELWNIWLQQQIAKITSKPDGSVYVPDTSDHARIFDSRLTYAKGAMVLHMLRWKLGDTAFFHSVQNYLRNPELAYSFAFTPDLQQHLEDESGQDLDEYFKDWIYGEGYPTYYLQWYAEDNGKLTLQLYQTQSHPSVSFFEMPVPVRAYRNGEDTLLVLNHTFSGQRFEYQIGFRADSITIDPRHWLVMGKPQLIRKSTGGDFFTYYDPASSMLRIEGVWDYERELVVEIIDMQGRIILNSKPATSYIPYQVHLPTLGQGLYIVRVKNGENTLTARFTVAY